MTKKNKIDGKEVVETFHGSVGFIQKLMEKYIKKIVVSFALFLFGILGYFLYQHFVVQPRNEDAAKAYFFAQKKIFEGKKEEALGGKSKVSPGFRGIYEEYSDTDIGKLAAYQAGILEFNEGNYQKAYDLIDEFSSNNKIFVALKYGIMGDCMANLDKKSEALSHFDKAISVSDDEYISYYFTRKAGLMALAANDKKLAKKYFSIIDEKYVEYDGGISDAYIEMVKYY